MIEVAVVPGVNGISFSPSHFKDWSTCIPFKLTSLRSLIEVALKSVRPPPLLATAPASHTPSVEFHTSACPSVVVVELKLMSLRSLTLLLVRVTACPDDSPIAVILILGLNK